MSQSTFTVEHVRVTADKPFKEFVASLEQQVGQFNPAVGQQLEAGGDLQAAQAMLESMAGPSGFMLFRTSDHGRYLRLVGKSRKALQYLIGNPLLAIEMTRYALGAGLYAPLRVLVYEAGPGQTCVEYDRPSSLFGQFDEEHVDRMAKTLDQKLAALIAKAAQ